MICYNCEVVVNSLEVRYNCEFIYKCKNKTNHYHLICENCAKVLKNKKMLKNKR